MVSPAFFYVVAFLPIPYSTEKDYKILMVP